MLPSKSSSFLSSGPLTLRFVPTGRDSRSVFTKETEPQGAIPKICWITWKQMFRVTKVVTASEQEWRNGVKEPTPPLSFSLLSTPLPPKPKLDLLFGSRSRRGQRKSQCISISCPVSSPMSAELNLGWPSSIPTEGCLAEKGKELALEDSRLQRSARKLSLPSDPCQYYNRESKIKNTPVLIKKTRVLLWPRACVSAPSPLVLPSPSRCGHRPALLSATPFLSFSWVHRYRFSSFHIYALIYMFVFLFLT